MTGREQCSHYRVASLTFLLQGAPCTFQPHFTRHNCSPRLCVCGKWRRAEKGEHRSRDDPVIPIHGSSDVMKRTQVRKSWVLSLALLHTSFQRLMVSFSLHPEGRANFHPTQFYRPRLDLRNEIRPEKLLGKT